MLRRLERAAGHVAGHLARLALDRVAQDERLDAGVPGARRRRLEGVPGPRDQHRLGAGEARIAGLGRLLGARLEVGAHRRRRYDFVARQDRAGVGEAGRVRHRGARGDARRVVAGYVGDNQRDHARRRRRRGQAPAFDRGKVLAHAVHLRDVRARPQEQAVDLLLVREGKPRGGQGEQGRAAARDQAQHEVVRRQAAHQRQDAFGGLAPGGVGDRMGRLDHLDPPAPHLAARNAVAVAGHHQALERAAPMVLDRARHGGRGLAGADHDGPPLGARRQVPGHGKRRVGGGKRRVE